MCFFVVGASCFHIVIVLLARTLLGLMFSSAVATGSLIVALDFYVAKLLTIIALFDMSAFLI